MQPTVLTSAENFNNLMALRVFRDACSQWQIENKNLTYDITIQKVYFDFGQGWEWTTIIATNEDTDVSVQPLYPRDWELIIEESDINTIIAMAWFFMDNLHKPYNERKHIYEKWG